MKNVSIVKNKKNKKNIWGQGTREFGKKYKKPYLFMDLAFLSYVFFFFFYWVPRYGLYTPVASCVLWKMYSNFFLKTGESV